MILQALTALYDRLSEDPAYGVAPPGFSWQQIAFKVVLHPDGQLFGIQDARIPNDKGKLMPQRVLVPGEAKPSGAGVNPCLLWDNQTYLLGRQPEEKAAGFGRARFEAFRTRHLELADVIAAPAFSAVCRFLESWEPESLPEHPLLEDVGPGFGVFQLVNAPGFVHQDPRIRDWWLSNLPGPDQKDTGQCLLTGEIGPLARLHPKIKGIPGAQAAGASMVSFNANAYESYGKEQSFNSPVGVDAAFRYGAALNTLLTGPLASRHRMRIGDTTCVFWTDRKSDFEDIFAAIATEGSRATEAAQDESLRLKIEKFLAGLRQGRDAGIELDRASATTRFYLLGLAPNAARLSVRFFHQSSLGELQEHLRSHFDDLRIAREFEHPVGKRRADSEFPATWELLRETARSGDEPPPLLGGALLRSILAGSLYPEAFLTAILRRTHIERGVNYLKAATIKAVLKRNHHQPIEPMLDPNNTDPPYLLGRLFAVLEKVQEEGHREQTGSSLRKTIRETYFSSACASPGTVFPRLEQLSTHHRRHLTPGRKVQFDQLISDIKWPMDPASRIARTHNLEQQGLFILGYYHQRKALFTKQPETAEAEAEA